MATVIDKAVQWAINIANDDSHGYSQDDYIRWGHPDYDCSSLVIMAWEQAGIKVKTAGATYTGNMQRTFLQNGFKDVTANVNLSTGVGLKRGDVLLNIKRHTELVIEDGGRKVGAHQSETKGKYGQGGDQTGHEIDITEYSNYPWDCVLRYAGGAEAAPQYTNFPKYNLSDKAIRAYAGIIVGECGGEDLLACQQMATLYINRNEVFYGRSNTEEALGKIIFEHQGIGQGSWNVAPTQTAINAIKSVALEGKRVLPRYVTNNDCMSDIVYPSNRSEYVKNVTEYKSVYMGGNETNVFYCFCGSKEDGDVLGYRRGDYEKYKNDIPWTEGADMVSSSGQLTKTTKQITKSVIKSEVGKRGEARVNTMDGKRVAGFDGEVELYIINKEGTIFYPCVEEGMTLTQERYGAPAVLKFNVLKTDTLNFLEGSQVVLRVRGVNMFYGYVFTKSRSKDNMIHCTAYDQLRYFKNKEVYVYQNKSAAELVKMIAEDFNLSVGTLTDTDYKIPQRVEDNVTLFDIVQTALSETLIKTGKMFFLYDDFGKLCIADASQKRLDIVIDNESAEDFDYQTSIDSDVCTRVKFYYDNDKTGERELYIANNTEKQNEWGVLQYCDKLGDGEDGVEKANTYLEIYKDKKRKLTVKNVLGVPEARAGYHAYVDLDLGDIVQRNFMLIEKIEHKFNHCEYTMDLTLRGGDFVV